LIEDSWKPVRWLLDVISQARNKSPKCGLPCDALLEWYQRQTKVPDDSHTLSNYADLNAGDIHIPETAGSRGGIVGTSASGTLVLNPHRIIDLSSKSQVRSKKFS
jgi:hypothetical protein